MKKLLTLCAVLVGLQTGMAQAYDNGNMLKAADSLFTLQQWKQAKQQYVDHLKDTSANSLAWNRLGYCNHNLGLYEEALKDYQRSLDNKPTPVLRSIVSQRVARVYAMQNKVNDATDWLLRSITGGYNAQPDLDTMAEFKNVRQAANYLDIKKKIFTATYPCSAEPHAHDFDFWIGEWEVYQTKGKFLVGHSLVQNIAGDCALLENWTSTQAHSGKSFNFYDPATGKWEQDWLGSSGFGERTKYINGEYKDGVMTFTQETTDAQGNKVMNNFKFYNIDKDTVRQYLERSTDGGKTYQPVYDFTYIRKKA